MTIVVKKRIEAYMNLESLLYFKVRKDNDQDDTRFRLGFHESLTLEGRLSQCLGTPSILATSPKAQRR